MFIKFDQAIEEILCCPQCKSNLNRLDSGFSCGSCGLFFPLTKIEIGNGLSENVYDFRIIGPSYCIPNSKNLWKETQTIFEQFSDDFGSRDSLQEYLDEIDSVKEIYTEEFHINGRVLDVGGHQGRLRHFLGNDVSLYLSIDPFIEGFRGLVRQPNLLKIYSCLSEPCNFLSANAEYLPLKSRSFDWVHMRSVVDHFEDPYKAFLEAYRISRIGGKLLIGLAILEKIRVMPEEENSKVSSLEELTVQPPEVSYLQRIYRKWKIDGLRGLYRAAMGRIFLRPVTVVQDLPQIEMQVNLVQVHDDHMFRFTHMQLIDLMEKTGWSVIKQHWQKPPYYYCIYVMGEARLPK